VRHLRTVLLATGLIASIVPTTQADAAFPGKKGLIAFSTDFSTRPQIFSVAPDGSGLRQLTHVAKGHAATSPQWSPDGTQIVFTIDNDIWVMNADGGHRRRLTNDPERLSQQPSWSPDGTAILYSRCSSPFGFQRCSINVMNADGTGRTKLLGGDWVNLNPEFSPDGTRIAYSSNRGGYVSNIWVMNSDGSDPKRLTKPLLQAWAPDWSPDGSHILFSSDSDLPFPSVWVMRSDGTEREELTHFPDDHVGLVARYSPDGSKIVLISDLAYPDHCCLDLYVVNADGSHLHSIVTSQPAMFATDWGTARKP
jgi:Tol biopolymer transport system component